MNAPGSRVSQTLAARTEQHASICLGATPVHVPRDTLESIVETDPTPAPAAHPRSCAVMDSVWTPLPAPLLTLASARRVGLLVRGLLLVIRSDDLG